MKILWLESLGMAVFASEEQETPEGELLTVQITDPQGNGVETELRIGGHSFPCPGKVEIPLNRLPPGRNSVFLKGPGGFVLVGSLEISGKTVKPLPDKPYALTVKALTAWNEGLTRLKDHEDRIRALEKSAAGVNILDLK